MGRFFVGLRQEVRERTGGETSPPIGPPDPVVDFRFTLGLVAQDAADNLSVENDRLGDDCLRGHDLFPMGIESLPVGRVLGGKGRHVVGFGIELKLEEYGEVFEDDIPQQEIFGHDIISTRTA